MRGARIAILLGVIVSGGTVLAQYPWVDTPPPRALPPTAASPTPAPSQIPEDVPVETNASITRASCGPGSARRTVSFRIVVDKGLRATPTEFGSAVRDTLCDARSWIKSRAVRFRYDPDGALLIGLRAPSTAQKRCLALVLLSVQRYYSCGTASEVVLNADRWFTNSRYFPESVIMYRLMLVNHEVGHAIGLRHAPCPANGSPAPVMMQQSKGMRNNGKTCTPNPWPLPSELALLR